MLAISLVMRSQTPWEVLLPLEMHEWHNPAQD